MSIDANRRLQDSENRNLQRPGIYKGSGLALFCHLLALNGVFPLFMPALAGLTGAIFPLLSLLLMLFILFLIFSAIQNKASFTRFHAQAAFNFLLAVSVLFIVGNGLYFVHSAVFMLYFLALPLITAGLCVTRIIATSRGEKRGYPLEAKVLKGEEGTGYS
ncbi:DUF4870 domain-containing protein [Salsuginibacillus kocurii]|uniref:DUF4870 domain-containing protein n=1 Tax=Salsuginibacillus kocurii TaxID=427078 RepID=UPI00035D519E|nr:DUF4870 domain-containing protein [Salsuginibacillus kocurii]